MEAAVAAYDLSVGVPAEVVGDIRADPNVRLPEMIGPLGNGGKFAEFGVDVSTLLFVGEVRSEPSGEAVGEYPRLINLLAVLKSIFCNAIASVIRLFRITSGQSFANEQCFPPQFRHSGMFEGPLLCVCLDHT